MKKLPGESRPNDTPRHSPAFEARQEAQRAAQRTPSGAPPDPTRLVTRAIEGPSDGNVSIEIVYKHPPEQPIELSAEAQQDLFQQFLDSAGRAAGRYQVTAHRQNNDSWVLGSYSKIEERPAAVIQESVEGPGGEGLTTVIFFPRPRGEMWELSEAEKQAIAGQFFKKMGRGARGNYNIHIHKVGGAGWQIASINRA